MPIQTDFNTHQALPDSFGSFGKFLDALVAFLNCAVRYLQDELARAYDTRRFTTRHPFLADLNKIPESMRIFEGLRSSLRGVYGIHRVQRLQTVPSNTQNAMGFVVGSQVIWEDKAKLLGDRA